MHGGGKKKFNIWIAYSDLYSNLTAFLFISAIGIFAELGSLPPPSPPPKPELTGDLAIGELRKECDGVANQASDVLRMSFANDGTGDSLKPYTSRLISIDNATAMKTSLCSTYYEIQSYADIERMKDRVRAKSQLLHQVCEQLWSLVRQPVLTASNGHLIIEATAGASSQNLCPLKTRRGLESLSNRETPMTYPDPKTSKPIHVKIYQVLTCNKEYLEMKSHSSMRSETNKQAARKHKYRSFPAICSPEAECWDDSNSSSAYCNQLRDALDSGKEGQDQQYVNRHECMIGLATARAGDVFEICRAAPQDPDFQDKALLVQGGSKPHDSRRPGATELADEWNSRVFYSGMTKLEGMDWPAPEGMVAVKVQFDPETVVKQAAKKGQPARH